MVLESLSKTRQYFYTQTALYHKKEEEEERRKKKEGRRRDECSENKVTGASRTSICLSSLLIMEYSPPDSWYNISVGTQSH